jgi:flagellar biosynthesis protein FliR
MFVPIIGGKQTPHMVKIGLSIALTSVWFAKWGIVPSISIMSLVADDHWLGLALAVGREASIGAFLGFVAGIFLLPPKIAGAYIAQEMGLTIGAITDPASGSSGSVLTHLLEAIGVLVFFALDIHHVLLGALDATFHVWELGGSLPDFGRTQIVKGVSDAQEHGIVLAAPIGICLFLTVVVLALLNKASPQLNLFSIGLVIRLCAGILAMLVFLPDIVIAMQHQFQNMGSFIHRVLFG